MFQDRRLWPAILAAGALLALGGRPAQAQVVRAEQSVPPAPSAAPAPGLSPDLEALVCARHRGFPIPAALRLRPDALPALWSLLDDPARERCWPGAVLAAGVIGAPEVYPRLRHLIERTASRPATGDAFIAMRLAFEGLGFLVWRDRDAKTTEAALGYLIESTDPATWRERGLKWRLPVPERRYVVKVLTATAVVGLAFTGHPLARDHLQELLARGLEALPGLGPDSYALVQESLDALEQRIARGDCLDNSGAEPGAGPDR